MAAFCARSRRPAFNRSDWPHSFEESAEYATVALKTLSNHLPSEGLKGLLAQIVILEFVQQIERAHECSLALSGLL